MNGPAAARPTQPRQAPQPFLALAQFIEQMAPHNVLARIQAAQAPPSPTPAVVVEEKPIPRTRHQGSNIGLYKQQQFVGKRERAGVINETGYTTGMGDVAIGYAASPPTPPTKQPVNQPTTVGIAANAATTPKAVRLTERFPATKAKREFTLYAPMKEKRKPTPMF